MSFLSKLFGNRAATSSSPKHGGDGMVSLVVLLPSWREIPIAEVREALDSLFPGTFLPARDEGNFVVDGPVEGASYLVQCTVPLYSGMFLIHNVPGPYSDFSDYLSQLKDSDMREVGARLPCWMSVDLMHKHTTEDDAYRFVSSVLAKIAPPDAALLLHPSRYLAVPFTPEVRRALAAGGSPYGSA